MALMGAGRRQRLLNLATPIGRRHLKGGPQVCSFSGRFSSFPLCLLVFLALMSTLFMLAVVDNYVSHDVHIDNGFLRITRRLICIFCVISFCLCAAFFL